QIAAPGGVADLDEGRGHIPQTGGEDPLPVGDNSEVLVHDLKENRMSKLRQRLEGEEGFTLIELLVVIVIIGILLAIAVPSYLGFRDRANKSAAQSNVKSAIPSAEAYFADHGDYQFTLNQDGTAAATPLAALQNINTGIA